MRKSKKIWLVILIALVALSIPFLRGADALHIDRLNQTKVGADTAGALAIVGLDSGIDGSEHIDEAGYLGDITNNFNYPVELEITVEIEFLEVEYTGNQEPEWRDINIFLGNEELQFANQTFGDLEQIMSSPVILDPAQTLEITIDEASFMHLRGTTALEHFLGVARFYIAGYNPDNGALMFEIEPAGDFRQQYFSVTERHTVTFNELNDLDATIIVYTDEGRTIEAGDPVELINGQGTTALPDGHYWYTATDLLHENYYGDFEVAAFNKTVVFEMETAGLYTVTFNEVNNVSATIQVCTDAARSQEAGDPVELINGQGTIDLQDGHYWFTAFENGYADYYGDLVVTGNDKTVVFEMTEPLFLYPIEQLYISNLQGQIGHLQHDPESGAAYDNWYEAIDNAQTELQVQIDEPSANITGTQTLKFLVRRTDNSTRIPELSIDLYQNGGLIATLEAGVEVGDATGQVLTYTFQATELNDISGSNVEVRLSGSRTGGPPGDRNTVEFGAIEWALGID